MIRITPSRHAGRAIVASLAVSAAALASPLSAQQATPTATPTQAAVQPVTLDGAWNGSGVVTFPSGDRERARCRVSFRKQSGNNYGMNAVCATSSARVEQTAGLARVAPNRYSGEFYNAEYNVTGSIIVTVHGNRLSATLNGGGASAQLTLSK